LQIYKSILFIYNIFIYKYTNYKKYYKSILYINNIHRNYQFYIYQIQTLNKNIKIGNSIEPIKKINLYYFPNDIEYTINVKLDNNKFECYIENNILFVKNKENIAWDELYECDIIIEYQIDILLLKEIILTINICSACVIYKKKKILQSRDPIYFRNKCW